MLKDNFNKFCLAVIALLVLLSLLFTIRASAEEYTAPEDAAGSSQDVPAAEEHPVTQVQGVQTYDPQLYERLDKMQESIDALTAALVPSDALEESAEEFTRTRPCTRLYCATFGHFLATRISLATGNRRNRRTYRL